MKHLDTGAEEVFTTDAVFPYVGHLPNTSLFVGQIELDRDGYIVTDGRTRTSAPGVFATGDAVDRVYRQAITAAASGAQAAMEASWYLDSLDVVADSVQGVEVEPAHALQPW
jgi:thioredoxin reductase (NADPH)